MGQDNVRGYTGHVFDEETGLTYMQARYYDAQIGRFMGVDPVGFVEDNPISFNRYAYANNNPYKYVDPNGEFGVLRGYPTAPGVPGLPGYAAPGLTAEQTRQAALALDHAAASLTDSIIGMFNEGAGNESDDAVGGLIDGLSPEVDTKGRPRKGHFVDSDGSAQDAPDGLPGVSDGKGGKVMPDGSRAGIHSSSGRSGGVDGPNTGKDTLHINRPKGKQDIKIRYGEDAATTTDGSDEDEASQNDET